MLSARRLLTAIASADCQSNVEPGSAVFAEFYRPLLFQQSPLHHLSSQARVQVDESCADNVSSLNRLIFWSTLPPQAGRLEDPRADDRVGKLLESEIRLDRKHEDNI